MATSSATSWRATLRTMLLMAGLMGLFAVIGTLLGGLFFGSAMGGLVIFLVLAGVLNFISYFWSDKIVLWSYRAKLVTPAEAPRLHRIVDTVCANAGLPKPRVAVLPIDVPNAFATGRNPQHAVVAATRGILNLLDDDELEAVMSHEMGHVRNRDVLVGSVAATIAAAITFPFRWLFWGALFGGGDNRNSNNIVALLVVGVLAAIAAMLVQMAISRSREYGADHTGAMISRKPFALASALGKLQNSNYRHPMHQGNPAHAHLFIVNPFRGSTVFALFSTHPPVERRIARLEQLAQEQGIFR
ncbi:MAG TPA: zinc metalloprotease HtpX [Candidatus Thermoplasmatota archaeon]|jgi:heat shock protein HtpX|nr:zinc metalloprotease HtpX [Candidatus Thermoplasmatota archaeon]